MALGVFALALGCTEPQASPSAVSTSGAGGFSGAGVPALPSAGVSGAPLGGAGASGASGAAAPPPIAGASGSAEGAAGRAGAAAGAGGSAGIAGRAGAGTGGSSGMGAAGAGGMAGTDEPPAFAPCPSSGEPCKILPLGDSITYGLGSGDGGGYRVPLFRKALEADQSITFVGSLAAGPMSVDGTPFPRANEGHSGRTIDFIAGRIPDPALDDGAHIILLMIGTNDMYMQPEGAPERLAMLLDEITGAVPDALLVVAQLTPFPSSETQVEAYNAAIPPLIEARAQGGKHVVLVDMHSDFATSLIGDGVHPNDDGYELMAERWYEAIGDYLPPAS